MMKKGSTGYNFSYPQVRQQWLSVGIFSLSLAFGEIDLAYVMGKFAIPQKVVTL